MVASAPQMRAQVPPASLLLWHPRKAGWVGGWLQTQRGGSACLGRGAWARPSGRLGAQGERAPSGRAVLGGRSASNPGGPAWRGVGPPRPATPLGGLERQKGAPSEPRIAPHPAHPLARTLPGRPGALTCPRGAARPPPSRPARATAVPPPLCAARRPRPARTPCPEAAAERRRARAGGRADEDAHAAPARPGTPGHTHRPAPQPSSPSPAHPTKGPGWHAAAAGDGDGDGEPLGSLEGQVAQAGVLPKAHGDP